MNKNDLAQMILNLSTDKFNFVQERLKLHVKARELRQEIYNLSVKVNSLEAQINAQIMDYMRK